MMYLESNIGIYGCIAASISFKILNQDVSLQTLTQHLKLLGNTNVHIWQWYKLAVSDQVLQVSNRYNITALVGFATIIM